MNSTYSPQYSAAFCDDSIIHVLNAGFTAPFSVALKQLVTSKKEQLVPAKAISVLIAVINHSPLSIKHMEALEQGRSSTWWVPFCSFHEGTPLTFSFLRNLPNAFLIGTQWATITGPCQLKPHYIAARWNVSAVYNNKEGREGEQQFKSDSLAKTVEIMGGGSQIRKTILKSSGTWDVMSLNWKETKRLPEARTWKPWMRTQDLGNTFECAPCCTYTTVHMYNFVAFSLL